MDEILPPAATADERRTRHAGALAEITKAIGASLEFPETFPAIARFVHGMFAQAILLVLLFQGEPELVGDYRRNELYAYLSYPAAQSLTSSQAWPPASFSFGRETHGQQAGSRRRFGLDCGSIWRRSRFAGFGALCFGRAPPYTAAHLGRACLNQFGARCLQDGRHGPGTSCRRSGHHRA